PSEAAGRGTVSEDLDAVERGTRPAATAAASLQAGDHPGAGEERTATPLPEPRSAAEAQAVECSWTTDLARAAAEAVGSTSARRFAQSDGESRPADRTARPGGPRRSAARQNGAAFANPAGGGSDHSAGLHAYHG